MTLRTRRTTILLLITSNAILLFGSIFLLAYTAIRGNSGTRNSIEAIIHLVQNMPGIVFTLTTTVSGMVSLIVLYRFFRRSSIPEIYLAMITTATLAFEALRFTYPAFHQWQQPLMYYELVSRVILFFQINGILGLFFVSFHYLELQHQKISNILAVQLLTALLFAYILPINTMQEIELLSHPADSGNIYPALIIGVSLLTGINLLAAWLQHKTAEHWKQYLGTLCMVLGYILIILLSGTTRFFGIAFYLGGLGLFSTEQYSRFLWH